MKTPVARHEMLSVSRIKIVHNDGLTKLRISILNNKYDASIYIALRFHEPILSILHVGVPTVYSLSKQIASVDLLQKQIPKLH